MSRWSRKSRWCSRVESNERRILGSSERFGQRTYSRCFKRETGAGIEKESSKRLEQERKREKEIDVPLGLWEKQSVELQARKRALKLEYQKCCYPSFS